jgi:hypothetical protein
VCGTVIRVPVDSAHPAQKQKPGLPSAGEERSVMRPEFRPVTIRTARDAVTAAVQYLGWLGYTDIKPAEDRPASGIDIRGEGVVAHVDPTTTPTALRDVETLWLGGLNLSAVAVLFSLAGYARDARTRADELHVPLYVMDLTGTPQPVNDAAEELIKRGVSAF